MKQPGFHTFSEITSQPDAWAQALAVGQTAAAALQRLWRQAAPTEILFTGCGSTYYLSLAAAALARQMGLVARAAPASEVWLFTADTVPNPAGTLLVAVSRSGTTTETLWAVDAFRRAGGRAVVNVTCYPDTPLAQAADLTLAAPRAQEQSVAQTRSFASMLVLCQTLVNALWPSDGFAARLAALPDLGRRLIKRYGELAARLGGDASVQRFFFLGNGPCYGLACEAMLKMKEMSLSYSEAYHVLEFRHGPKSMVDEKTLVVGLVSDDAWAQEMAVLADMRALGARTLTMVDGQQPASDTRDNVVHLGAGLALADRLVLYLPVLQLLAYQRALANRVDPDAPNNLTAVVEL